MSKICVQRPNTLNDHRSDSHRIQDRLTRAHLVVLDIQPMILVERQDILRYLEHVLQFMINTVRYSPDIKNVQSGSNSLYV